ncbi:MAG TPA: hypothetical protein VF815_14745 [Myxococcaceae bacterium]|jgi:hypothetical protein
MPSHTPLHGLDRLIAICQGNSLPLKLSPPLASAPQLGESVMGKPFDPQLAGVYRRVGAAKFGPLSLYGSGTEEFDLLPRNEWAKGYGSICFEAALIFGQEMGFADYLATVPQLAGTSGLQPVVYICAHDAAVYAVPIASSVDRFFDLYSRYLERMVADFEYIETGVSLVTFPWNMSDLIRHDEPLMEQVRAGRFDFLTNSEEGARKWLRELLSPPSSPL